MARPISVDYGALLNAPFRRAARGRRRVIVRDAPSASQLRVKLLMASTSDKLDLSDCELVSIPEEVFELSNLKDLSLAGNALTELPSAIGQLTALERLVVAGNDLEALPTEVSQLPLKGLWAHGNHIKHLPEDWSQMTQLEALSLAGNALECIPASMGLLPQLSDLNLAGNRICALPESFAALQKLQKLHVHGNQLSTLPGALGVLPQLQELKAMGNQLMEVPNELLRSSSLKRLNLSDNTISSLPHDWSQMTQLQALWLYGNSITHLPESLAALPSLQTLWLEGNSLQSASTVAFLAAASENATLSRIGLDARQLPEGWVDASGGVSQIKPESCAVADRVKLGRIAAGSGRGYFKLQPGPVGGNGAANGSAGCSCLVVAFGSAPGDPNWGGLLSRLRAACKDSELRHFDILFVVDTTRSWYNGGDDGFDYWYQRIEQACSGYDRVMMIGDSMGATACLLFSPLATAVIAFTPQVDLNQSSIRSGDSNAWRSALRRRLLTNVEASKADIQVHTGTWAHDLEQAKTLPFGQAHVNVHHVDSHRLAFFLDSENKLLPIVQEVLANQMSQQTETPKPKIRLANIL